jgi:hypothetical protein
MVSDISSGHMKKIKAGIRINMGTIYSKRLDVIGASKLCQFQIVIEKSVIPNGLKTV